MVQLLTFFLVVQASGPTSAEKSIIDNYGNKVRGYLMEQPTDGRFGSSRVPSIHNMYASQIDSYAKLRDLSEKYCIYVFVAGTTNAVRVHATGSNKRTDIPSNGAPTGKFGSKCIMRLYDKMDWQDPVQGGLFYSRSRFPGDSEEKKKNLLAVATDLNSIRRQLVEQCFKSKADTTAKNVSVTGKPTWVSVKTIIPKVKSCYKCHEGVKEGEPIGEVLTFLIKKDAHESR